MLCKLYNDIIKSLKDAAEAIPTKASNTSSKHTVLCWNDLVRDSHQAARESFFVWRSAGSSRHGPLYDIMKIRRAHFKLNKRLCEKNAEILRAERLASKLCNNDLKNFWKDLKHMNYARLPNPSNVGAASGAENVKNMWLHHGQSLLNSITGYPTNIKMINGYCSNVHFNVQMIVNVKEIQDYDSVSREHFKYANEKLHVLMSLLYSSMLIHCYFSGCYDDYNHSPHN